MFMAFMSLLIAGSVPLLGGSLHRLAGIRLQHTRLVLAALGVQILITDVIPGAPRGLLVALHLASYAGVAVALWANRRLPGLLLIGAGGMLNAAVIALNHGTLPASARALSAAGLPVDSSTFANSGPVTHPVLAVFGDIVATPAWLPFRNVISIGDLIILIGAAVLMHSVGASWPARWLSRNRPHRPAWRPRPVDAPANGKFHSLTRLGSSGGWSAARGAGHWPDHGSRGDHIQGDVGSSNHGVGHQPNVEEHTTHANCWPRSEPLPVGHDL